MRISDWSSDVCSSDLARLLRRECEQHRIDDDIRQIGAEHERQMEDRELPGSEMGEEAGDVRDHPASLHFVRKAGDETECGLYDPALAFIDEQRHLLAIAETSDRH